MKNIIKLCILIIAFTATLPSNLSAQNQKRQSVKDFKKNSTQDPQDDDNISKINGKFYIGIDAMLQESILGTNNPNNYYEPKTSTVAIFSGFDNKDFFKIEGFYSKSNEKKQIIGVNNFSSYELRTRTVGFDFKPYLNFDKKSQAIIYLIFGLNYNKIEAKEFNESKTYGIFGTLISNKITSRNSSLNKVSPTFGFGVEYLFYKNFALRLQYKRNFVDAKIVNSNVLNKVKIIESYGLGISHDF